MRSPGRLKSRSHRPALSAPMLLHLLWRSTMWRTLIAAVLWLGCSSFAPAQPGAGQQLSPTVVFVLDVSDSMNEQKRLPLMRAGVAEFICILPRSARIGIVQFNHESKTLMPLATLDDAVRQKALAILHGLKADGGTD